MQGYGPNKKQVYVATQCPLANTASDFWRLAKDTGCVAIVMLNNVDPTSNNNSEVSGVTSTRRL